MTCLIEALQSLTTMDAVTLAIALFGAGLSALNTWNAMNQDRERVSVRPYQSIFNGVHTMGVEVINNSSIPITVDTVGFDIGKKGEHVPVLEQMLLAGSPLPWRIDPHHSKSVLLAPHVVDDPVFRSVRRAYCTTATDKRFTGTSKALAQIVREGRRKS